MPRLNVWHKDENYGLDFCLKCWPPAVEDGRTIADLVDIPCYIIEGAIDDLEMPEHPPYSEWEYLCLACGERLTDDDN